jgi:sporulation delaying protein B
VITIEFGLFVALFIPGRIRIYWLIPGVLLHAGIAVCMGLISFSLAMIGCLVLFLIPADRIAPIRLPVRHSPQTTGKPEVHSVQ